MSPDFINKHTNDISDPSDWFSTSLPKLADLDSLQRCYICKEFLKAPVITSCNHTFCSHCIRQYLVTMNHCPLCKTEQFESNLKRDILLEEIVASYANIRPALLHLLGRNLIGSSTSGAEPKSKKRPLDANEVIEILSDDDSNMNSNNVSKKSKPSILIKSEIATPTKDEKVQCPICSEYMLARDLQATHIDYCLKGLRPKTAHSNTTPQQNKSHSMRYKNRSGITSFFQPRDRPIILSLDLVINQDDTDHTKFYFEETSKHNSNIKKLPKLDYASLATSKLKDKLLSLKLSTQGTRSQLEQRYNYYYVLFNSNSDSNRPVPEKTLRQKLNQWELSNSGFNNQSTSTFFGRGKNLSQKCITDKDFLPKEWMHAYKSEFRELTEAAKLSRGKRATEKKKIKADVLQDIPLLSSELSKNTEISDDSVNSAVHSSRTEESLQGPDSILTFDFRSAISNSSLFVEDQDINK
ncbi:uncharacterized protein PRCAT00002823001 [Priceomyces carsonii]|uniref:uncharacterized protein n=1 Tax=Priceomyces carsonii TaxID=28549 RepID=UPI002EDB38B6|nr:unnamed protein product [Priceomyces carsonii]